MSFIYSFHSSRDRSVTNFTSNRMNELRSVCLSLCSSRSLTIHHPLLYASSFLSFWISISIQIIFCFETRIMLLRRRILPIFQYSICIYRYENSVQYTTPSSPTLYSRIKRLMDDQRYREALQLFHQSSYHCNDATITLALKIVTKLKDHQSGIEIHRELSSKALKNPWIQSCLIHFYSRTHHQLWQ